MTNRRQSREIALQALFHRAFSKDLDFAQCLENFKQSFSAPEDVWNYAQEILEGVENHQEKIDSLINGTSSHWNIERMALVDLSLMRIALYECLFSSTPVPPKVGINEALDIAKRYSSKDSSAFINGILDQILSHHADS